MAATVFYLDPLPLEAGTRVVLDGPEGHHAADVRRVRPGESIVLADGKGRVGWGEAETVAKGTVSVRIDRLDALPAPSPRVTVIQGLPKSDRAELAVELMTEAGADRIIPWEAARCVSRWQGPKAAKNAARWQRVAASAAKQSRRPFIPEVSELAATRDVAAAIRDCANAGGIPIILHEDATLPLAAAFDRGAAASGTPAGPEAPEVILIVGPEGGVSPSETETFTAAGAVLVRLGPTVLRTSTAAAVTLGALGVLTSRWNSPPMRF